MTVPSVNDHLLQARANRAHAEWLLSVSPSDPTALHWAVTAAFYSALHGLTAHLMTQGITVSSHAARAKALADPNTGVPQAILYDYRTLEAQSRGARYELWSFVMQDVQNLVSQELAAIAAFTGM